MAIRIIGGMILIAAIIACVILFLKTLYALLVGQKLPDISSYLLFVGALGIGLFVIYTGKAVTEHKEWSRFAGLIISSISLLGFPIGTLIGLYNIFTLTITWRTIEETTLPMNDNPKEKDVKKTGLFSKIESKEDAIKAIKESSIIILFIATLQIGLGRVHYLFNSAIIIDPHLIFEAILCIILACILLKWKSRVAAIFLFLLSSIELVMTFIKWFTWSGHAENNIPFALIIAIFAYRLVEATSKLQQEST